LAETHRAKNSSAPAGLGEVLHSGFYPRIHDQKLDPTRTLADYFATYVERDLRQLAAVHDLQQFERFVRLCAGRTGQLLNLQSLEALKDRLNAGDTTQMYFYRDSEGNEVDLLLPSGGKLHAIAIKVGATVNSDYFKGLKSFAKQYPLVIGGGGVVYGGTQNQNRSDWPVHSWQNLLSK
jgi:predicted AAA+ superfamily ATPase